MLLAVILLSLSYSALGQQQVPERCNEIQASSAYVDSSNATLLSISWNLFTQDEANGTFVYLSNISIFSSDTSQYKYSPLRAYINGADVPCQYTDDLNCFFEATNSTFLLHAMTTTLNFVEDKILFYGVVDELSFSMAYGSMFTRDHTCEGDDESNNSRRVISQFCCTNFLTTNIATTNAPKCSQYHSRSTVYNMDDNYSVFATADFNYTLTEFSVELHGLYVGPDNSMIGLSMNDFWNCGGYPNAPTTCDLPYFDGDNKFLFLASMVSEDSSSPFAYEGLAGRLILRSNQTLTLMEEGTPFTTKNDCTYFSNVVDEKNNRILSSEFCCTQFSK